MAIAVSIGQRFPDRPALPLLAVRTARLFGAISAEQDKKDADSDILILQQAKAEYAKLQ